MANLVIKLEFIPKEEKNGVKILIESNAHDKAAIIEGLNAAVKSLLTQGVLIHGAQDPS